MLPRYLTLIGRTFIATFLTVNFFNIIPLDLGNNSWLSAVSMLFVDTGSLLLLGLVCLKICNLTKIKQFSNNQSKIISEAVENSFFEENTKVNFTNKVSKIFMIFFIILGLSQSYLFVTGLRYINFEYSATYQEIESKYLKQKEKIETEIDNIKTKNEEINSLDYKKNKYILEMDKNVSKTRFILFKSNLKVLIMSLVWAFGLFKLSNFNDKEDILNQ